VAKRIGAIVVAGCALATFIAGTTSAGIQGSGKRLAAYGRITSLGGVTVNGVEYATTQARISVDGRPAEQSQLRAGQVVTLHGTVHADGTTGTAQDVSFVSDIRGPITALDPQGGSFSVLQQTVRMTDETLTDGAELQIGTTVSVSGFTNSAGELVASRVDVADQAGGGQLRGPISALDSNAQTFMLNTLLVDYQQALIDGELEDGAVVVVQGSQEDSAGLLVAQRVDVAEALAPSGQHGDVEGIITSFASAAEFALSGQRVVADEHTRYKLKGGPLGPDVVAQASGRFEGGVLVADKIETKKAKKND
jgi:hypothetical protein